MVRSTRIAGRQVSLHALITLARVVDIDLMHNLAALDPGQDLFQRNAAALAPPVVERGGRVPVYVGHDKTRPIGWVRELSYFDDGDGTWLTAHCVIDERPCWLERGTRRRIGYSPMVTLPLGPTTRIMKAWINEVSVLPPTQTAHNVGARGVVASTIGRGGGASDPPRPVPPPSTTAIQRGSTRWPNYAARMRRRRLGELRADLEGDAGTSSATTAPSPSTPHNMQQPQNHADPTPFLSPTVEVTRTLSGFSLQMICGYSPRFMQVCS